MPSFLVEGYCFVSSGWETMSKPGGSGVGLARYPSGPNEDLVCDGGHGTAFIDHREAFQPRAVQDGIQFIHASHEFLLQNACFAGSYTFS